MDYRKSQRGKLESELIEEHCIEYYLMSSLFRNSTCIGVGELAQLRKGIVHILRLKTMF